MSDPGGDLRRLGALARVLDDLVVIPGTRIRVGLDALVGLLPGVGDVVAGLVGAYAIVIASRRGAPPALLARMVGNVLVDMVIGSIPVLGDLFDVAWKANRRNYRLLLDYEAAPRAVGRRSALVVAAALAVLLLAVAGAAWLTVLAVRWLIAQGA